MTINLKRFCATTNDPREHLHAPFRCADGIVATNGHVLVCIADDGGDHAPATDKMKDTVPKFRAMLDEPLRQWHVVADIELPKWENCHLCGGLGHRHIGDCEDCDGEGDFHHGNHIYQCKECGGEGTVETSGATGEKVPCWKCDGFGDQFATVRVGNTLLQRRYLALLAELPNCRIGVASPMSTVAFKFDGGFGALMPCRE